MGVPWEFPESWSIFPFKNSKNIHGFNHSCIHNPPKKYSVESERSIIKNEVVETYLPTSTLAALTPVDQTLILITLLSSFGMISCSTL